VPLRESNVGGAKTVKVLLQVGACLAALCVGKKVDGQELGGRGNPLRVQWVVICMEG